MENDPSEFLPEPERMVEPTVGQLGLCDGAPADDAMVIEQQGAWCLPDGLGSEFFEQGRFSWLDPS
jgi:hypothetical protein